MVGTGGIGSGSFFLLTSNETLEREESRGGRFLPRRDYCKLHIITHYVKLLLGDEIAVYPIGRVGDDNAGPVLLKEMERMGMDMRFVRSLPGVSTLFSFCFLYPDGSGGNLTTEDSASGRLSPGDIAEAAEIMRSLGIRGIALAAPEAPLAARAALLDLATIHGLFRAAGFTRSEMEEARRLGLLDSIDLLAVNGEEARAAAGRPAGVEEATAAIAATHPRLRISVTAGREGSWTWDGRKLHHHEALRVEARGTTGAGDAHFAGILCGLAAGLDLADAQSLGTLLAGASVTSQDTINREIDGEMLRSLCRDNPGLSPRVRVMLDTPLSET